MDWIRVVIIVAYIIVGICGLTMLFEISKGGRP